MNKKNILLSLLIFQIFGCTNKEQQLFEILDSSKSGITFENNLTETDDLNILDYLYFYNGGGIAIGDINNDGLADVYFTGNQVKNKLYLNKGNMKFEDITLKAGVEGNSDWNTGVVMGDVNGDGLLDIYVCAVVGVNGFNGHNELFINNGDATFTEKSSEYGLDFDNYSSTAAFIDYDLDGDLDIYLVNHAIHNQTSFGKSSIRNNRTYESGDKLLRNDGNTFVDVSEESGIFGGPNGYGLGIAISDFNLDGYPDIYVANDFHEDDYFYINNGNGTFSEKVKDYFGHISRFSMGNDVADINNDGYPDLLSLDMLPEDEKVLKSSAGDDNVNMLDMRINQLGYHYQYSRNMLQLNNNGESFTETALLSGISATDWSWSALFNDYNQDGIQDLFISNGIPKRPNDLDYINFTSNDQIRNKLNSTKLVDQKALELMPSGYTSNVIFEGAKDLKFINRSKSWASQEPLISNGTAYGDLDNDGDLDIITNNLNSAPSIYQNQTNNSKNYLKINLKFTKQNTFGIGTKISAYSKGKLQYKELYTVRGFQSSSEPIIHFGFDQLPFIDSIVVVWPNNRKQTIEQVKTNQSLTIKYEENKTIPKNYETKTIKLFKKVNGNLGITYKHEENSYIDFDFQKLIPFRVSDRGPATAVGDLNNDGLNDIYLGASSRNTSSLFLLKDTTFIEHKYSTLDSDRIYEDTKAVIDKFNKNGTNELFVASGGGEFKGNTKAILDRLYSPEENNIIKKNLPEVFTNTNAIVALDYNNDGFQDIFIGSGSSPMDYGRINSSYILQNNKGDFSLKEFSAFKNLGIITDAIATDFDQDKKIDLIVVGEWMSPRFLRNTGNDFEDVTTKKLSQSLNGLWQSIAPYDIDNDGDMDYLLGNWGLNSKYTASADYPLLMYYGDFDNNKSTETILAIEKNKEYFTVANMDELSSQMVSLIKKKFPNYKDFAGKNIYQIFDQKILEKGALFKVHTLQSGYLKNENDVFVFHPFPNMLQVAPINTFLIEDFYNDGKKIALAAGNYFGVTPFHSRYDGFNGAIIKNENEIILGKDLGLDFMQKTVRDLNIISVKDKKYLLVTINNNEVELYEF